MRIQRLVGLLAAAAALVGCTTSHAPRTISSSVGVTTSPSAPASMPLATSSPTSLSAPHPMSAAARIYLYAALDVMQTNAVNRAKLNWPAIRQQALDIAVGATAPGDTYPAIASAVGQLQVNGHSSFNPLPTGPTRRTAALLPLGPSQLPSGKLLSGRIGYVALPGVDQHFAEQYKAAGAKVIRTVLAGHPDGWILDLRSNDGGDIWPMLAGIQPLLGTGPIGSFVSPPTQPTVIRVTPTKLTAGADVQIRMPAAAQQGANTNPVVVLTGPITGSSGELAAIVFRGRPCTTSMGSPTYGVPTANVDFYLSDGADLRITTAFDADRTGHVYPDAPIPPDLKVGTNYNATWHHADPTIRAATHWLSLHHGCRP